MALTIKQKFYTNVLDKKCRKFYDGGSYYGKTYRSDSGAS